MGSPPGELCREDDELAHDVIISRPFYISSHEVTQAEFKLVMGYNPSCYTKDIWDASLHCGIDFDCGPDCPVESVTWSEAAAYCNKLSRTHGLQPCYFCTEEDTKGPKCIQVLYYLGRFIYTCEGYRLPTEAEWEYAYRAGTTTSTYGGELSFCESPDPVLDPIAWYWFNSENRPHPVGLKKPNAFGLYDMAGNVSEWVHDLYADYPFGTSTDPNPDVGGLAIVRGGGFTSSPKATRASDRITTTLTYRTRGDGFRCVRSIEAQP
jgi:formylglycine-generating enzyme required for sulfatase activity